MDIPSDIRIIYVDDDEVDRHIFEIVLNKIMDKPHITFIKNGEEFLDFFYKKNSYRDRAPIQGQLIIFLDINMPHLSGLDVLRRLSETPPTAQEQFLPIVMFSGSEREKDIYESKRLGAMDYVVKPFSYQEMMISLSSIISGYVKSGMLKEIEI